MCSSITEMTHCPGYHHLPQFVEKKKQGKLLMQEKKFGGGLYKEKVFILYADGTLGWYDNEESHAMEDSVNIRTVSAFILGGARTRELPNCPSPPPGGSGDFMMAIASMPDPTAPIHWIYCHDYATLLSWMEAFIQLNCPVGPCPGAPRVQYAQGTPTQPQQQQQAPQPQQQRVYPSMPVPMAPVGGYTSYPLVGYPGMPGYTGPLTVGQNTGGQSCHRLGQGMLMGGLLGYSLGGGLSGLGCISRPLDWGAGGYGYGCWPGGYGHYAAGYGGPFGGVHPSEVTNTYEDSGAGRCCDSAGFDAASGFDGGGFEG